MEKEKLFSKLKDYNNKLEKILDKKSFSLDIKNLLLSMLYKIENAYEDYADVKVEVMHKNDFIRYILETIERDCKEIELVRLDTEQSRELEKGNGKYIVDKYKEKIMLYPNELHLLHAILEISRNQIYVPAEYRYIDVSLIGFLNKGTDMNEAEVIRDFNGWSWDVSLKEIEDIDCNIAYQALINIVGCEFVYDWMDNTNPDRDYIQLLRGKMQGMYGKEYTKEFLDILYRISIDTCIKNNAELKNEILKEKEIQETELKLLENQKEYLGKVTNDKKEYTKEISKIDRLLNNPELLKAEYKEINSKLPNKEKIFSVSHFSDKLEKQREELLEKIKECNNIMDPKGYVERKTEASDTVSYLNSLNLEKYDKEKIVKLCWTFLDCFNVLITKAMVKKDIIELIYKLRYFRYIPFDEDGTYLKDIQVLKNTFNKTMRNLIKKACEEKVLDNSIKDSKLQYIVYEQLFNTKITNLENIFLQCSHNKGTLYLGYYDGNVLEDTIEVKIEEAKIRKKIKLFI